MWKCLQSWSCNVWDYQQENNGSKHTLLILAVKRQAFDMAFICTVLFKTNYCFDNTFSFHSDMWSAVRKMLSQVLNRQVFVGRVGFLRLCSGSECEVIHDDYVRVCWCEITQNTFNGDKRLRLEPAHVQNICLSIFLSLASLSVSGHLSCSSDFIKFFVDGINLIRFGALHCH